MRRASPWQTVRGVPERDRHFHSVIARLLLRNPTFLDMAKVRITRWIRSNGPYQPYLEWHSLLQRSSDYIAATIAADTEQGDALRARSPIVALLTEAQHQIAYQTYTGRIARERSPQSANEVLQYIGSALYERGGAAPSIVQARDIDYLLVRLAHSTMFPIEVRPWLINREPLLAQRPIDLLCVGNVLRLVRIINAIDEGEPLLR